MNKKQSPKKGWIIVVVGIWVGIFLGVAIILGLGAMGVINLEGANLFGGSESISGIKVDTVAPEFQLESLSGEMISLSDFRGQIVVLNFWATWCGPCIKEMPMLQEYQEIFPEIVVLGVDLEESRAIVEPFIAEMGVISYTILLDPQVITGELYQIFTLPTTFFIDANGIIKFRHIGYMSEDQFSVYLQNLGVSE